MFSEEKQDIFIKLIYKYYTEYLVTFSLSFLFTFSISGAILLAPVNYTVLGLLICVLAAAAAAFFA